MALVAVIHKKLGNYEQLSEMDSPVSSLLLETAVYHVRTFLNSIYCPSAMHSNHEGEIVLRSLVSLCNSWASVGL